MRKLILICASLFVVTATAMALYAENIYLKDDKDKLLLKGTITEETQDAITKYRDKLKEPGKSDIQEVVLDKKEDAAPESKSEKPVNRTEPPMARSVKSEATRSNRRILADVKLSYDMPAKLNLTSSLGSGDAEMLSGFTLGVDGLMWGKGDTIGCGSEIHLAIPRGMKDAPEAKIGFLAFLAVLELSNYNDYRHDQVTPYFRLQGGGNKFLANSAFLGDTSIGDWVGGQTGNKSGMVYGGSIGFRKKQGLMAELAYSYYTATTSYWFDTFHWNYSPIRLSVGYAF